MVLHKQDEGIESKSLEEDVHVLIVAVAISCKRGGPHGNEIEAPKASDPNKAKQPRYVQVALGRVPLD